MLSVMNSLNIVSRLTTTPPPSPPRSRTASSDEGDASASAGADGSQGKVLDFASIGEKLGLKQEEDAANETDAPVKTEAEEVDETTPLLAEGEGEGFKDAPGSRMWAIPRRIGQAVIHGVKVVFTTITAPGRYVIACFYDDQGHFSAILPLRNFKNLLSRRRRRSTAQAVGLSSAPEVDEKKHRHPHRPSAKRSTSVDSNTSSSTFASSDGEGDLEKSDDSPARHTRSRTAASHSHTSSDLPAQAKRSMRVKLQGNEEVIRKRRAAKAAATSQTSKANPTLDDVAQALKSPSSPASHSSKLTRYPRTPAPPRPLVPRRQPSYTMSYSPTAPKKTLIIDLDETLIHSMAKGGRMSTGHMVEVRLNTNPTSPSPPTTQSLQPPQTPTTLTSPVPILYYVHERPSCHEFLRKVSRWYTLIIFTASVQEYADPVIDWLERERRYFSGRYYRQHCTLRNGAYIKDLAQVEPDLSRVMILDNSPMSYIFHEDNAIPIEGWISDPTDNDLLHLIPLLEGLQYATDVRALLALRQGQAQQA